MTTIRTAPGEGDILSIWDDLSAAIDKVTCSLPHQMTADMAALERQRLRMRKAFHDVMLAEARRPTTPGMREEEG